MDAHRPQGLDDYVASYAHIAHVGTDNIDTRPETTTRGPITDQERHHAPTILAPWTDGGEILDEIFLCLRMLEATGNTEVDPPRARFPSRDHVEETGSELPVMNSEAAVNFFDYDTIYRPAEKILDFALTQPTALRTALSAILHRRRYSTSINLGTNRTGQIVFSPQDVKSGPGDCYCSIVSDSNPPPHHLLLVGQAKAPHKLTRRLVQSVLGEMNNTIDIRQFIQSPPSSADVNARGPGGPTDYDADQRWLAAVAMQIYSSLLNRRVRYGYITTGESYVLVRIRPGQATTLEYLLLPALRRQSPREVEGREAAWLDWLAATPLARMSCLALLSLFGGGQLTEDEVAQTKAAIPAVIWETPQYREQTSGTGSFKSTASMQTRGSDPEWTEEGEQSRKRACDVGNADEGESDSEHHQHKRACISETDNVQQYPKAIARSIPPLSTLFDPHEEKQEDTDLSMDEVPFCSSRCLRSLTSNETTDLLCPNSAIHAQTHQRPTSAAELRTLAQTCVALPSYIQAAQGTEDQPALLTDGAKNAVYMHSYGASSALFKVRVGGYVLAAKAARAVHPMMEREVLRRLRLEDAVYKRLNTMQGHGVPVCLGLVDVSSPQSSHADHYGYIYNIAQFSAFLLLSWAGSSPYYVPTNVDVDQERAWLARFRADVDCRLSQIHGLGIFHGDAELRNIVVTSDGGDSAPNVSLVDFERAVTKGRFARRLARDCKGTDEKNVEQRFQQACEREKKHCLQCLDGWAERRIKRIKLLTEPSYFRPVHT